MGENKGMPESFSLRELLDASPAIISLIDTEQWHVAFQNTSGKKLLGEITGRVCYENIPKLSENCSFCKAREALTTGQAQSAEVPRPDGTWLLVQWAPVRTGNTLLAVETIIDITAQKLREEEYQRLKEFYENLATIDPLTELLNRRGWLALADRLYQRAFQNRECLGVLLMDIDHFKLVNDRFGHPVGDQVLGHLAALLRGQFRPGDLVGRWGGEEFIIVFPTAETEFRDIAERVRHAVQATPFVAVSADRQTGDLCVPMTVSIGGSAFVPGKGEASGLEAIIAEVDRKLYLAKHQGRNQVVLRLGDTATP